MQVDDKDFIIGKCPMTVENCKKYEIKDKYIETFCSLGCSPDCSEELKKYVMRKRR